jgi:hypothetical protein
MQNDSAGFAQSTSERSEESTQQSMLGYAGLPRRRTIDPGVPNLFCEHWQVEVPYPAHQGFCVVVKC